MQKNIEIIEHDLFDISARLKSIDESYFLVFNRVKKRFEVHSTVQRGDTLAVVLPFPELDARAITHVRYTRAERHKQILAEIERSNERLEKAAQKKSLDRAMDFAVDRGLV